MLLAAAPMLLGMDTRKDNEIPEPSAHYRVKITDRSGYETVVTDFSIDGDIFLGGQIGEGKLFIDLDRVQSVSFGEVTGDEIAGDITLNSGEILSLKINKRLECFGKTPYGHYKIGIQGVRQIDVLEKQPGPVAR